MALANTWVREDLLTVRNVNKKIGGYLMAMLLLVGIAALASSTAQAQYPYGYDPYRRDDRYRNRRYDPYNQNNIYQIAQQQGYSYGMNVGAADAQRGQSYNPQRSRYFRNANSGYNSYYGNRGQYQQVFRNAFVQGYREGYMRYGGYDRRSNNGRWGNGRWPW
jgi:hypothetical protein